MNKQDLLDAVASQTGTTKVAVDEMLTAVLATITKEMSAARAVQLGLGGPDRDLHHPCDLLVPVSLDVVEHQHLSRPFGELGDRAFEVDSLVRGDRPRGKRFHFLARVDALTLDGPRLAVGEDQIHAQPVEPGAKGRFPSKRAQLAPRPHEDLLGQLVRVIVPGHAPGQTVNPSDVHPIQAFESPTVSGRCQHRIRCLHTRGRGHWVRLQHSLPGVPSLVFVSAWTATASKGLESCGFGATPGLSERGLRTLHLTAESVFGMPLSKRQATLPQTPP